MATQESHTAFGLPRDTLTTKKNTITASHQPLFGSAVMKISCPNYFQRCNESCDTDTGGTILPVLRDARTARTRLKRKRTGIVFFCFFLFLKRAGIVFLFLFFYFLDALFQGPKKSNAVEPLCLRRGRDRWASDI